MVYSAPILLGLSRLGAGEAAADMHGLANAMRSAWTDLPVAGPILVFFAVIFMVAALLSTAESYVLGMVSCLAEDVLQMPRGNCGVPAQEERRLEGLRVLCALSVVSLLPLLLILPDFELLFVYLFYSANGFVGPLVALIFRRRMKGWAVATALTFGFAYPLPGLLPESGVAFPRPGIVPVFVSLALVWVFSSKRSVP